MDIIYVGAAKEYDTGLKLNFATEMASVKVLCPNLFLMQRFISVLGKPNEKINRGLWREGVKFAAIAA